MIRATTNFRAIGGKSAAVAVALGLAMVLVAAGVTRAAPLTTVAKGDLTLGSATAPVIVIEYASASSPHSAEFHNEVFPAFKAKYIDTGKVRYVFREFLTPPEEVAAAGFMTARCAGRDKYFGVIDAIYQSQRTMFESGDVRGVLLHIAESAGLSDAKFDVCVNDEGLLKALNDRVQTYMTRDKINGTPTFVVNGKVLDGAQTLPQLDDAIAAAQASR